MQTMLYPFLKERFIIFFTLEYFLACSLEINLQLVQFRKLQTRTSLYGSIKRERNVGFAVILDSNCNIQRILDGSSIYTAEAN